MLGKETIFPAGYDSAFPSCHASTLAELPSGDLLAAWYAGSYEKASDIAVPMAYPGRRHWPATHLALAMRLSLPPHHPP